MIICFLSLLYLRPMFWLLISVAFLVMDSFLTATTATLQQLQHCNNCNTATLQQLPDCQTCRPYDPPGSEWHQETSNEQRWQLLSKHYSEKRISQSNEHRWRFTSLIIAFILLSSQLFSYLRILLARRFFLPVDCSYLRFQCFNRWP